MRPATTAIFIAATLSACAPTRNVDVYAPHTVDGPRLVALVGPLYPWTSEIEKRLRQNGVTVKRLLPLRSAARNENRPPADSEPVPRVVLRINGDAPNTALERCMGGGYKFKFITAELIDLQTEETLGTYSNSGFSEDCAPLSGTIFGDIARMVASVFR